MQPRAGRNVKLLVEYDGTRFGGWQTQANAPSVQSALQEAVFGVTGDRVHVQGAGRTDAGVHARGQAANFFTMSAIACEALPDALNAHLPPDVAVLSAQEVASDFHAQYSALGKTYLYRILNRRARSPLERDRAWLVRRPLDVLAMREGARPLIGTHDFRAFAVEVPKDKNTVRTVKTVDIDFHPPYVEIRVGGDGFLYKMVRTLVGTLALVGHGRLPADEVPRILASGRRKHAGPTAPAGGLYLMEVWYP